MEIKKKRKWNTDQSKARAETIKQTAVWNTLTVTRTGTNFQNYLQFLLTQYPVSCGWEIAVIITPFSFKCGVVHELRNLIYTR